MRSGNDSYDSVEKTDSMVQTERARPPLRQRPIFFHYVLGLYQRWSERWKRENPEHREDSASPGAGSPADSRVGDKRGPEHMSALLGQLAYIAI